MYQIFSEENIGTLIYRVSDCAWIPPDPANTDYQEYLAWLEEGNVPEEWNPEEVI